MVTRQQSVLVNFSTKTYRCLSIYINMSIYISSLACLYISSLALKKAKAETE